MKAVELARRDTLSHEEWLQYRRGGIGASDVAGIMGLSKWATPLSVWYDKTEGLPEEESVAMEVGLMLEPYLRRKVAPWFKENKGIDIEFLPNNHIFGHPEIDYFRVNLDDHIMIPGFGPAVIEYKTASEWSREWGEGEIPDAYYAQVQFQMFVMDYDTAYIFALIGNRKIVVREVPRNEEFIKEMVVVCKAFWEYNVQEKVPPAPAGTDQDEKILKLLYPGGDEEVLRLDDLEDKVIRYLTLTEAVKDVQREVDLIRQEIMAAMGDHEVAMVGERKVTWKTTHRKEYLVPAKTFRTLRIYGGGKDE